MSAELTLLAGRLEREPGGLEDLMASARRVEALDRAFRAWAEAPWADSVRVANVRGDALVLFADSAAALVPLRYRRNALLAHLREHHGLTATRVEAKVRPGAPRPR